MNEDYASYSTQLPPVEKVLAWCKKYPHQIGPQPELVLVELAERSHKGVPYWIRALAVRQLSSGVLMWAFTVPSTRLLVHQLTEGRQSRKWRPYCWRVLQDRNNQEEAWLERVSKGGEA